ncbi:streptomycin biosynthesis protein [Saccharopolyspora taberi]|uniref:ParB N-terminal domain-containing protein n=1 Tax=Saccharopolyspora taberi TaxID=60895 RepID=A0ABN3VG51_9PSEU
MIYTTVVTDGTGEHETPDSAMRAELAALSAPSRIAIAELRPADSPRANVQDDQHVRRLLDISADRLPPIVVHRATRRVIDGMHRLTAARLRGDSTITAVFFDGSTADAFVLGVRLNARHGLPLSRAERSAAAAKIIASHPGWSDRMIAEAVGISAKVVAAIRCRVAGEQPSGIRIGKDGRARPVDGARRRALVERLLAEDPGASLRKVAREAGVAVETVRRIRARSQALPEAREAGGAPQPRQEEPMTPAEALRVLKNDPTLRFSETSRTLLRLLDAGFSGGDSWQRMIDNVPQHCAGIVAGLARQYSEAWMSVADQLSES